MVYIIDANNLAGRLNILKEKDFDKKLIKLIKEWNAKKDKRITLVFDSLDPMGDKVQDGKMTIVYTPRDNYYRSADDKIIEFVKIYRESEKEEVTVISDDRAIGEAIEKLNKENGRKIHMEQESLLAEKLIIFIKEMQKTDEATDDKNLSQEQIKRINKDLLKIWK